MIGVKIYHEKATGDVILTIPEKHNENATPTTKEQDFAMYNVLQARNPDTVDFIQLPYGKYRAEFQSARSWRVDVATKTILFEYPEYDPPLTEQIERLKQENEQLRTVKESLEQQILAQQLAINMLLGVQ